MTNEPIITITGNLTAAPAIFATTTGRTRVTFTVASTPRQFDKNSQQWISGEPLFMRCTAWGTLGDHIIESLDKGAAVIVQGRLTAHSWQTETGEKRSVNTLQVDEIGASLRFANVQIIRSTDTAQTFSAATQQTAQQQVNNTAAQWGTSQPQPVQQGLLNAQPTYNQAPPF